MFSRKSGAQKAREQVVGSTTTAATTVGDQLRERVVPAVEQAAREAREWAAPRVEQAREWAQPRVERGLEAAAPRVEEAVDRVSPRVDAARDRIVDDLLPRIVEAVNAAAAASAAAANGAKERGEGAAAVLKGEAVAKPKHRKRTFLLFTLIGAGAAAGVAAWKRSQPQNDPWATPSTAPTWASPTTGSAAPGGAAPGSAAPGGAASGSLASGDAAEALDADAATEAEIPGTTAEAVAEDAVESGGAGTGTSAADVPPKPGPKPGPAKD